MASTSDWAFYERHFAKARLQHYLTACGQDRARAMQLYRWNVNLSAALWASLAYFEVAFRNALDARMQARHLRLNRSGHWIFDDYRELGRDAYGPRRHRQPYKDVVESIRRVRRNNKQLIPGQVISELPFGFWHQLISRKQMHLWPDIAGAFPNAPDRSQETIQRPVARIREVRNRIGHHHRVRPQDAEATFEDIVNVAGFLHVDLRDFITDLSRVSYLLTQQP